MLRALTTSARPAAAPLNADEEAVLRALGRVMIVLPRALDADMLREQGMSLSEYLALMNLSEAPGRTLRMSELAATCDMSLSGMTRLAGKLEADGLLRRERCQSDGRVFNATLTDDGLSRLQQAWPSNLASVRRHVFDHLAGADLRQLGHLLENIAGSASTRARRSGPPSVDKDLEAS